MVTNLASDVTLEESDELNDVWMRIFTERGSSPILIVANGVLKSEADIGKQVLNAFEYLVKSPVFDKVTEKAR